MVFRVVFLLGSKVKLLVSFHPVEIYLTGILHRIVFGKNPVRLDFLVRDYEHKILGKRLIFRVSA